MSLDPDFGDVKEIVLSQYMTQINRIMPDDYSNVRFRAQIIEDTLMGSVLQIRATLLAYRGKVESEVVKIEFPSTWFEGFKKEFFPQLLLKRWPVKMTTLTIPKKTEHVKVCPHLNADAMNKHLQFFYYENPPIHHGPGRSC